MNDALELSRDMYRNGYYADKLQEGKEYEDYMASWLYELGIVIVGYSSFKYQCERGENRLGAEIKRDGKFRETGNLYIETEEKAHPNNAEYVPAGVSRQDNGWLFITGDEQTAWIFPTVYLRRLESRYHHVETPTSRGYLLPVVDADRYCARRLDR